MDEILSFDFSNAEYSPWIVPNQPEGRLAAFVHQEIEKGAYWENMERWIYYIRDCILNLKKSILYNYKGNVYPEAVWIGRDKFLEDMTTGNGDRFNFLSVYFNGISDDSAPPLYYMLLHLVSSFLPGQMSPWMGGIINLAAIAICFVFFVKIGMLVTGNKRVGLLAILLYGLSGGGIITALLIRMYGILTMFCMITWYLHLKKWRDGDYQTNNLGLIAVTILGFWTQYYFLVFAFFLGVVTVLGLLRKKKCKAVLFYIRSMLIAGVLGVLGFPDAIKDIFGGGFGPSVIGSLFDFSGEALDQMKFFVSTLMKDICGAGFGLLATVLIVLAVFLGGRFAAREKSVHPPVDWVRMFLLMFPGAAYFLLVAKVSPFYADRYIMPVFAAAALLTAFGLEWAWSRLRGCLRDQKRILQINMLELILVLGLGMFSLWVYSGENTYLYKGYGNQTEVARQYADYPCLCLYDGATFYENLPEFIIYRETLLLNSSELDTRTQSDLLTEGQDVVLILKRGIDEEWARSVMDAKYGYHDYIQIYQDPIYGEKVFLCRKS